MSKSAPSSQPKEVLKNLHGLAQQISGDEGVERRGPIMLVVWGAPHAATATAAGRPQVGPAVGAA